MSSVRSAFRDTLGSPAVLGVITILVTALSVYLSYTAENGLPFRSNYIVNVDVADAGGLSKNADVRIGSARVGQVLAISPQPGTRAWPHPFAELRLQLDTAYPLPADTHYALRYASALGGDYVQLIPGDAALGKIADGATLTLHTDSGKTHEQPAVDIGTALSAFGPAARRAFQRSTVTIGDALAGRGSELNDSIGALRQLTGPTSRVLRILAAPHTRLGALIPAAAGAMRALASTAPTLGALISDANRSLAAVPLPAVGSALQALPSAESTGTSVLTNARPVLTDGAAIVQAVRPAAPLIPTATEQLDSVLAAANPVFARFGQIGPSLDEASASISRLTLDPATAGTFKTLRGTDLPTAGGSAIVGLGAILKAVAPAQLGCDTVVSWAQNLASAISEGDRSGTWIRFVPVINLGQTFLASQPSADLHVNIYPTEAPGHCEAGNESYGDSQTIGRPASLIASAVPHTSPPHGVLDRGAAAGLVP